MSRSKVTRSRPFGVSSLTVTLAIQGQDDPVPGESPLYLCVLCRSSSNTAQPALYMYIVHYYNGESATNFFRDKMFANAL